MPNPGSAGRIYSHDVEEFIQVAKPWEVVLRQISPGPFHARLEYVQTNGILAYREHWTRRILATGATPEGYFMFGGSLAPRNYIDWCGGEASSRHLAYGRPSCEVSFVIPKGSHHAVLLVPSDIMRSYIGEETISTALSSNLHHLVHSAKRGCGLIARIDRMISKYLAQPELLANARECKAIESQLLEDVAEVFPYSDTEVHCTTPTQRRKAFCRAIEFSESLSASITVPEYAAVTGVSQRSLELAFEETLGITPRKYLRWRRLQNVHRQLRTKDASSTTVTKIATHWGFSELGRFAGEYKKLFGKSPSMTLKDRQYSTPRRIIDLLPI